MTTPFKSDTTESGTREVPHAVADISTSNNESASVNFQNKYDKPPE